MPQFLFRKMLHRFIVLCILSTILTASAAGNGALQGSDPTLVIEAFACKEDSHLQQVGYIEQGQIARICVQAKLGVTLLSIKNLLFTQEKAVPRSTVKAQRAVANGKIFSRHSHVSCQDRTFCVVETKLFDKFFAESEEFISIRGETSVKLDSGGQTRGGSVVDVPFTLVLAIQ